jgi:hypothetical protein
MCCAQADCKERAMRGGRTQNLRSFSRHLAHDPRHDDRDDNLRPREKHGRIVNLDAAAENRLVEKDEQQRGGEVKGDRRGHEQLLALIGLLCAHVTRALVFDLE